MVRSKAGTNGEATIKIPKINMYFDQQNPQYQTSVTTIMKPLRIFQFFVVLLLVAFMCYMIVLEPTPISDIACILLIVLSGTYTFVLAVELISYFGGEFSYVIPVIYEALCAVLFSEIGAT